MMHEFPIATDNFFRVGSAIEEVMHSLYVKGVPYYRCGVGAVELESSDINNKICFSRKKIQY